MVHSAPHTSIAMKTLNRSGLLLKRIVAILSAAALVVIGTSGVNAAEPADFLASEHLDGANRHPLYNRTLPPGAIWSSPAATSMQHGSFQPVAFSGPEGTTFSLPNQGAFAESEPRLMAGLMVGAVYRFRITNIPLSAGAELYPTVELIGRTYPPAGLETLYPIPINVSESDLRDALEGRLVTRVIYLEDPQTATPLAQKRTESRPTELMLSQDPLAVADSKGRPIAVVRIGSVAPPRAPELIPAFYFGNPPWAPIFQPEPAYQSESATGVMQTGLQQPSRRSRNHVGNLPVNQ